MLVGEKEGRRARGQTADQCGVRLLAQTISGAHVFLTWARVVLAGSQAIGPPGHFLMALMADQPLPWYFPCGNVKLKRSGLLVPSILSSEQTQFMGLRNEK